MDILIRGMEMPKDGNWKTVRIYPDGTCAVPYWSGDCKVLDCTAIPIPEGHGRLIDAEAYVDYMQNRYDNNEITNGDWIDFRLSLKDQPTIVPAEGGTDDGN